MSVNDNGTRIKKAVTQTGHTERATGRDYDWDNADDADYAQVERIAEMSRELYRRGLPTTHVDLETFDLDRDQAAQLERQFEVRLGPDGVREVDEHLAAKAVIVAGMRESLRLLPQNPGRSSHTPAATRSCGWTTSTPPLTRST